jgi:hypothetical protein
MNGSHSTYSSRVEWLLEEAFVSSTPVEDFKAYLHGEYKFLEKLSERADTLREASAPRLYWPHRAGSRTAAPRQPLTMDDVKRRFASLVSDFDRNGYLANVFPHQCVDEPYQGETDESGVIHERLGVPGLWPLQAQDWDDDTFFGKHSAGVGGVGGVGGR